MSSRHTYLYHYRNDTKSSKFPVGCLAVQCENNEIKYAFSTCSPLDKFNSELAQKIAFGRLKNKPQVIKTEVPTSGHKITACIMQHIVQHNGNHKNDLTLEEARDWRNHRHFLALKAAQFWLERAQKLHA